MFILQSLLPVLLGNFELNLFIYNSFTSYATGRLLDACSDEYRVELAHP